MRWESLLLLATSGYLNVLTLASMNLTLGIPSFQGDPPLNLDRIFIFKKRGVRSSLYWQLELSSDLLTNSVPESENIDSTLFDDFCMHSLGKSRLDLECCFNSKQTNFIILKFKKQKMLYKGHF